MERCPAGGARRLSFTRSCRWGACGDALDPDCLPAHTCRCVCTAGGKLVPACALECERTPYSLPAAGGRQPGRASWGWRDEQCRRRRAAAAVDRLPSAGQGLQVRCWSKWVTDWSSCQACRAVSVELQAKLHAASAPPAFPAPTADHLLLRPLSLLRLPPGATWWWTA